MFTLQKNDYSIQTVKKNPLNTWSKVFVRWSVPIHSLIFHTFLLQSIVQSRLPGPFETSDKTNWTYTSEGFGNMILIKTLIPHNCSRRLSSFTRFLTAGLGMHLQVLFLCNCIITIIMRKLWRHFRPEFGRFPGKPFLALIDILSCTTNALQSVKSTFERSTWLLLMSHFRFFKFQCYFCLLLTFGSHSDQHKQRPHRQKNREIENNDYFDI